MNSVSKTIVVVTAALVVIVFILVPPIPQPQDYYNFADNRGFVGIPNFWDVISNVPFFVVGIVGLCAGYKKRLVDDSYSGFPVYSIFFLGLTLTSLGSAWFHFKPNNQTLVWDRLPMTIGFMALTAGILSEYTHRELQKNYYIRC